MPKVVRKVKTDDDGDGSNNNNNNKVEAVRGAWQMWHQNGTRCPKGTVPIRRSTLHDVLRAKSLFHFGKKQTRVPLTRSADAPDVVTGNGHEVFIFIYLFLYLYAIYRISLSIIFNIISIYIVYHHPSSFPFLFSKRGNKRH